MNCNTTHYRANSSSVPGDPTTRRKTGKPKIIYLTTKAEEVLKRLVDKVPAGTPLLRTTHGRPWGKDALNCRFRRIREKYPELKGVSAYTLRHSYATDALEKGVPIAAVAELMGHSSTKMVERVYGHLEKKVKHMQEMAHKAAGDQPTPQK